LTGEGWARTVHAHSRPSINSPERSIVNHYLKVALIAIIAVAVAKRVPVLNQLV